MTERPVSEAMSDGVCDLGDAGDKPQLNLDGLWKEWDNEPAIRSYLREDGAVLFPEGVAESVKNASKDYIVTFLTPLLLKMAATENNPQPLVDPLREQIAELYKSQSKVVNDDQVILDSWATRKFLGFVKKKCRLEAPSKVAWVHLQKYLFCGCTFIGFFVLK